MSTETTIEPTGETPADAEGTTPDEPLGEPGLAALKSEREARKKAEKAAADALDRVKAFEDAQKTEAQKAEERLAEIVRENAELKTAKLRADVAEAKSDPAKGIVIPAALLTGSTQEELEASADALIAFKGTQSSRLFVPNEGKTPQGPQGNESDLAFADFLTGRAN